MSKNRLTVIYKNHYRTEAEGSSGYSYHTARTQAEQKFAKIEKEGGTEPAQAARTAHSSNVAFCAYPVPIGKLTKGEIVKLLNRHAGHPDNG